MMSDIRTLEELFARRGTDVTYPPELPPGMLRRVRDRRAAYVAGFIVLALAMLGSAALLRSQNLADANRHVVLHDGDVDTSFGAGGVVTTDLGSMEDLRDLSVDPAGGVVAVGCDSRGIFVARYEPDGSLDPGFGHDGVTTTALAGDTGGDCGMAVAVQADGGIVVSGHAGYGGPSGQGRIAVLRYLADGTLDPSFGEDGIVTTDVSPGSDAAGAVAVQPDGKIVVAGGYGDFSDVRGAVLARYDPDGSLDQGFGEGGIITMDASDGFGRATDVEVQPDGRIIVAGAAGADRWAGGVVLRLRSDGSLDPTFGTDGHVTIGGDAGKALTAQIALTQDGAILGVGTVEGKLGMVKLRADGRIDSAFADDGVVGTDTTTGADAAEDITLLRDGRIVVAGTADDRCALVRYLPNGALDDSFGSGGSVVTEKAMGMPGCAIVSVDGAIVAGGTTNYLSKNDAYVLMKYVSET